MDACNRVSVLQYRGSKPLGKVRRRIQDVRIPSSSSCYDLIAGRPELDLSHNECARLAVDCLLSRGLEGYHRVLEEEGEVDFLSKLDKSYILEYGMDGNTGCKCLLYVYRFLPFVLCRLLCFKPRQSSDLFSYGPGASDDDDDDVLSLSASSRTPTRYPEMSTDSDPTVTGLDQDVKSRNAVLGESSVGVFLSSDSGAAGIKDLVRQFIRKAKLALAIVVDSFTDVELLCDLLEASRKRNVSVHLLLDRRNLSLFVSIWHDVKLESRNFPKLSVRGVCGQNYCAKTGRKLTGQIAESFIIADWTEVLTGSYSFSWLSWQVHRSLAVLIKGSSVAPFLQEFHRLYSSSNPVAGFVSFITLPLTLHPTSHEAHNSDARISKRKSNPTKAMCLWAWVESGENTQTKAAMPLLCNRQGPEVERGVGDKCSAHSAGPGSATQLGPKPLLQPGTGCRMQSIPEEKPIHPVGAASSQTDVKTNVELPKMNRNQSHGHSDPRDQNHLSHVQSQLGGLTITATDEKKASVQESQPPHAASTTHGQHRTQRYQSAPDVGPERLFFQPSNRNMSTKPSRNTSGFNTQRGQWGHSLNFKPNVELPSGNFLPPRQAKTNLQFAVTHLRGHSPGLQNKISSLENRRLDQPSLQAHPNINPTGSQSARAGVGSHLRPQFHRDRPLYLSGTGANMHLQHHHSQQMGPPPGLNWTPQNLQAAGSRFVARQRSFSSAQGTGQPGWRPFQSGMTTPLGRSNSMTDRHAAGFCPNRT
ncbi:uncharacterized protein LOC125016061 [Mugil cephalus]|uniref:uncharacterized protein LOC125016061 n=1 Tax=Mugil cephalus TaxID=48193 RepID=UPI001FB7D0D0|nr:uncharacterized protein LOC125016061 [Mugil cephalus]